MKFVEWMIRPVKWPDVVLALAVFCSVIVWRESYCHSPHFLILGQLKQAVAAAVKAPETELRANGPGRTE